MKKSIKAVWIMCIIETCFLDQNACKHMPLPQIPKCKSHHTHLTKKSFQEAHILRMKTRSCECYKAQLTVNWLARHTSIFIVPPGLPACMVQSPGWLWTCAEAAAAPKLPHLPLLILEGIRLSKGLVSATFIIGEDSLRAERQGHRYDFSQSLLGLSPPAPHSFSFLW